MNRAVTASAPSSSSSATEPQRMLKEPFSQLLRASEYRWLDTARWASYHDVAIVKHSVAWLREWGVMGARRLLSWLPAKIFCCLKFLSVSAEAVEEGNPTCWQEGFSYEMCCDEKYGPEGNKECWDGMHWRCFGLACDHSAHQLGRRGLHEVFSPQCFRLRYGRRRDLGQAVESFLRGFIDVEIHAFTALASGWRAFETLESMLLRL